MDIFITTDWNGYLSKFHSDDMDIYYSEEYTKLYEDGEHTAFCVVCTEEEKVLIMPYLRSEINGYYDFETAYGYGGPISNSSDAEWNANAMTGICTYLKEQGYVCGFVRFHPLLQNEKISRENISVIPDRKTIVIDTRDVPDEIWNKQISSKNRNMIRKAERNGLVYKAEYDFSSIEEFIDLYDATMKRLGADDFYFFDRKYYREYVERLEGRAFLGTVRQDEKLICAALFMYSEMYGHYHLEGSDHNVKGIGANNFLLWKTAEEMHTLGVKQFHLGGGYNSDPDNSLFKFKKAFSPICRDFYIGKMIFDKEIYEQIKGEWCRNNPDKINLYGNRLLCYRY